jgi:Fe-S oxidoreductase
MAKRIVKNIPGIKLVELEKNRCCGVPSLVPVKFSEISIEEIGSKTLEDAKRLKVDILITACPACNLQFLDVKEKKGYDIEILDLPEIVASAIG